MLGKKDRCGIGKPCGASCINRNKICWKDLAEGLNKGLSELSSALDGRPHHSEEHKGSLKALKSHFSEMEGISKKLVELRQSDPMNHDPSPQQRLVRSNIAEGEKALGAAQDKAKEEYRKVKGSLDDKDRATIEKHLNESAFVRAAQGQSDDAKQRIIDSLYNDIARERSQLRDTRGLDSTIMRIAETLPPTIRDVATGPTDKLMGRGPDFGVKSKFLDFRESVDLGREFLSKEQRSLDSISKALSKIDRALDSVPGKTHRRLLDARERVSSRAEALMKGIRDKMLRTSLSEEQVRGLIGSVDMKTLSPKEMAYVENFIRMFNGRGFYNNKEQFDVTGAPVVRIFSDKRRVSSGTWNGVLSMYNERSAFHELAHILEVSNSKLSRSLAQWRDQRAFTEAQVGKDMANKRVGFAPNGRPTYKLNDITGTTIYGPDEKGVVDSFGHPYMGKIYAAKGRTSTEVMSLAVEHFASPGRMVTLYNKHPDLFQMVVGLSQS